MKKIVGMMGQSAYTILAVSLLLTFISVNVTDSNGNKGLVNIVKSYVQIQKTEYSTFKDSEAARSYTEIMKPRITLEQKTYNIKTEYILSDFMTAVDGNGNEIEYKINQIKDQNENDCTSLYDPANDMIEFQSKGSYILTVSATDAENVKSTTYFSIIVNQ